MNRSVTLPADGGGVSRQAGIGIETPPQASRRRSRLGSSTAVASLARHVICAVAARSSHAPAHAAPVQPLPWECRRPPVGCSLCRFASAAAADPCAPVVPPFAPGRARARGCGGAAAPWSAANAGIKGAPSSPRSSSVRRVGSKAVPTSTVVAMRQPTRDALGGGIGNVFRPLNVIGSPPGKYQTCGCVYEPPPAPAPATAVLRGAAPSSRSTLITSASRASRPRTLAAPCSGCPQSRASSHRARINDAPAARSTPGSRFAWCLSWFVLAHPARPSLLRRCGRTTEISVRRRVRPAKKESLHAPPKAVFTRLRRPLIAGEARESS